MLRREQLDEFKALYEQRYGVALDDTEASATAEHVLAMIRAIYRPMPKDSPFAPEKP